MKQVLGLANRMGPLLVLVAVVAAALEAQQVAETVFRPPIEKPAYPAGKGPMVLIDGAHLNFHTATGRYLPFAELWRRDGYVVYGSKGRIAAASRLRKSSSRTGAGLSTSRHTPNRNSR